MPAGAGPPDLPAVQKLRGGRLLATPCMLITYLRDMDGGLRVLRPLFKVFQADSLHWIRTDPDMDPIREDPRFQTLIAEAEARLAAQNT